MVIVNGKGGEKDQTWTQATPSISQFYNRHNRTEAIKACAIKVPVLYISEYLPGVIAYEDKIGCVRAGRCYKVFKKNLSRVPPRWRELCALDSLS